MYLQGYSKWHLRIPGGCAPVIYGLFLLWGIIPGSGMSYASEGPGTAMAKVQLIKEVALPKGLSSAQSMVMDTTGRLWFTEKVGKKLTVFDPKGNKFRSYSLPASWGKLGFSKIASSSDGAIWFTVNQWIGEKKATHMLGRFTPADGYFTKYILSIKAFPEELFVDAGGVIWFFASNKNNLYRVDPVSFAVKGYPIPTPNSSPGGLSADQDGNLWFVESNANKIGKFLPDKGVFYEYRIPTPFANPRDISVGSDGKVWFVEQGAGRLAAFYPDKQRFDEAIIPTQNSAPSAIAHDGHGNIWFLEYRGNKVGVFNPKSARFHEYDIPTFSSFPADIAIDRERSILWFTQSSTEAKRLGMLSIDEVLAANKPDAIHQDSPSGQTVRSRQNEPHGNIPKWMIFLVAMLVIATLIAWFARKSGKGERSHH